jgi:hypothetical protein
MVERKYVITVFGAPVIFDKRIIHSELHIDVQSAGFVRIWTDPKTSRLRVVCFGESTSMGIKSQPASDESILEGFLNNE